jgi:tetratricopeptide (TPR) repeat protein
VVAPSRSAFWRRSGFAATSLAAIRHGIELDSMFSGGHTNLGDYYEASGRLEEAVHAYERAVELSRSARPGLARVLAHAGRTDEARAILRTLQEDAASSGLYIAHVAPVFLALGQVDDALEWLERFYAQRHPSLRFIVRRHYARLEGDPRFLDLLRRIGVPH